MDVALCETTSYCIFDSLLLCGIYIGGMVVGGPLSGRPRMPVGTDSWRGHGVGRPLPAALFTNNNTSGNPVPLMSD